MKCVYLNIGFWLMICFMGCDTNPKTIDVQGHRGCRGLYPENTIEGFMYAIKLGVTTLELDVVVNKNNEVIISHEPFYHPDITTFPDGIITDDNDIKKFNIYTMTFEEMKRFDVGKKVHPRFRNQKKVAAVKPRLEDLFYTLKDKVIRYNIEIKRVPAEDGVFHPEPEVFVDLVMKEINRFKLEKKVTIQSFDIYTLQLMKNKYPETELAFLTDDLCFTFEENIKRLGFLPEIYSPGYDLVTIPLIRLCHKNQVKIIPWTVNNTGVMRKLIRWNVDGIITDYPDRLIKLLDQR
ncbi:MAG: glycerophosphodiester phosphodiesterase [Saprospiraceae bacterium]|nr:glycerophosphodiester phosphodiesterase [Saprospiraceae bacterium]